MAGGAFTTQCNTGLRRRVSLSRRKWVIGAPDRPFNKISLAKPPVLCDWILGAIRVVQEAIMSERSTLAAAPRKRFRRLLSLAVFFGVSVLLVAIAPGIVARTPLRSWIVAQAVGPVRGTIRVGAALVRLVQRS